MDEDLVQWLRVQLDTDAKAAEPYAEKAVHARDCDMLPDGDRVTYPCDCGVPARVLREIEAKRALVDEYTQAEESLDRWTCPDMSDVGRAEGLGAAIALLAVPYADRSGYREEWRP
jgi:hypothetical protein